MERSQKKRLIRLLRTAGITAAVGLFYAGVCFLAGGPVLRCPFRTLTGLLCPGCGVSHLCLALLRLDVKGAFHANAMLLLLLPYLALLGMQLSAGYVRTGHFTLSTSQRAAVWMMAAGLILFAIWRNLALFGVVAPLFF